MNLPAHYRLAEDLLDAAGDVSLDSMDRLTAAVAGVGHAILATAQPATVAGAQNERDHAEVRMAQESRQGGRLKR